MALKNGHLSQTTLKKKYSIQGEMGNNAERGNNLYLKMINRWHNHLDPMVRKSPWNEAEEFVFIEAHKISGNKWAEIAKMIPGR
jgi:hypothetical protein